MADGKSKNDEAKARPVDVDVVHRHLNASRDAHMQKKRAAGVIDNLGNVISAPNWPKAEQCIVTAFAHRIDAHDLDPTHSAPSWAQDTASDKDLLAFYIAYARPFLSEKHLARAIERYPEFDQIAYIP